MSIDSLYNSNPSLKLKILQDVVDEYKGFLAGASVENTFDIFGDPNIQRVLDEISKRAGSLESLKDDDNIKRIQKAIINKFLFSSNGCYQTKDLLGNELVFDNLPKNVSLDDVTSAKYKIGDVIAVLFEDEMQYAHMSDIAIKEFDALDFQGEYLNAENVREFNKLAAAGAAITEFTDRQESVVNRSKETKASMRKMLKSIKFTDTTLDKREFEKLEKDNNELAKEIFQNYLTGRKKEDEILKARKAIASGVSQEQEEQEAELTIEEFKNEILPIYTSETRNQITSVKTDFINNQSKGAISDPTVTAPAMSSFVIKDPSMGISSRNDNFLSVFLGAVTPLEMSRCTPYLTLTFFNEAPDGNHREYLDNIAYMKFAGGKEGVFSTGASDSHGFGSVIPTYSATEKHANRVGSKGYMDIFTSPQTMVNANINKGDQTSPKSLNNQQLENVLDPFAPMLTLKNMSITVPGGQYFLVTNRRATLSITLHDRSRLEDISPFVSLNQLGRTIVRIEHGWSHPDGDIVTSKNTIGKFLNSMREAGYYSLTSSDFTFSGNAVTINLTLDFFGATDFVDNHICFGEKKPIESPSLQRSLSRMFEDILASESFKIPQVKDVVKEAADTVSKKTGGDAKKGEDDLKKEMKKVIKSIKVLRTHSQNSTIAVDTEQARDLEAYIKTVTTGKDNKFVPKNEIIATFLNKFFNLLGVPEALGLPDNAPIDDVKKKLGEEGFSKTLNEKLRLNYAKETIEKVNSLLGERYNVNISEQEKKAKVDLSPNPIEQAKKLEEKAKQTETVTSVTEKQFTGKDADVKEAQFYAKKLTPDYFLNEKCLKTGTDVSATGIQNLRRDAKDFTSLGKLICALVGLPAISGSSNYSELQIFFYPINNQAAGARKYTTASLPVNNIDLLKHIEKAIKNNFNLTLKNFFEMLSNMFENDELDVYEIGIGSREKSIDKLVDEALKQDKDNNHKIAFGRFAEIATRTPETDKERKTAFNNYKSYLYKEKRKAKDASLNSDLKKIYSEDKLGPAPLDKFVKPILQMEIEAIPIIALPNLKTTVADGFFDVISKGVSSVFGNGQEKNDTKVTGKDDSKRILRIHIYDSNSSSKPFEKIAMESSVEFDKFIPFGGAQAIKFDASTIKAPENVEEAEKLLSLTSKLRKLENDAVSYFKSLSPKELKQYLIRSFPTIRYGSQISTVKQISVRSNTSENIIEARLQNEIKKAEDKKQAHVKKGNDLKEDFSSFVIPTSVDITLYGCPFISVGAQIFLDLGTGTDIDNVYMVTELNHQIGPGEYSTTITVQMPAQGTVKSSKDKLVELIKLVPDVSFSPL